MNPDESRDEPAVALVTGGAGGVGGAVVERLVTLGHHVVAGSRKTASLPARPGVTYRTIDVRSTESVDAAFDAATGLGRLRTVVNSHGIVRSTPFDSMSDDDLWATLDTNLAGTARVCRAAANRVVDGGSVVNISSVGGSRGFASSGAAYGASKAGIEALTRYYAVALASRGVRVNTVVPGPLDHVMGGTGGAVRRTLGDFADAIKELVPLGRPITVDEVAEAVVFLASDRASGITGVALPVEGGLLAK